MTKQSTITIQKPNLARAKYFNSKKVTPDESMELTSKKEDVATQKQQFIKVLEDDQKSENQGD
eukprot:CAMPEP_0170541352 /NCGR_PEP_ID=MMETSP0211-20121228/1104_1 /TAXON_ID=311385 /ORGANISM="Pseudokeronopsis sp., Strain OXSARD2" /LENGTH=62 /DNA_ID=CAMNT_0010844041 /DNA_START=1139 /DNA_END=1327 /DNA_ORIENTATION=+